VAIDLGQPELRRGREDRQWNHRGVDARQMEEIRTAKQNI